MQPQNSPPPDSELPPTMRRTNYYRFRDIIQVALNRLPEPTSLMPLPDVGLVTTVARCRDALKSLRLYGWDPVDQEKLNNLSVYWEGNLAKLGPAKRATKVLRAELLTQPQNEPIRVVMLEKTDQLMALAYLFDTEVLTGSVIFRPNFTDFAGAVKSAQHAYPNCLIAEHTTPGQYVIL